MKERLVRGTTVSSVVRALRAHDALRVLPEIGQREQELLRRQVQPSTWYSLEVFENLLQLVHRYVHDGSEAAAQQMGRDSARLMLANNRLAVLPKPIDTLRQMNARWREHFNFGEVSVQELPDQDHRHHVRIQMAGYPDMSATHGHSMIGSAIEIVERAGAKEVSFRIHERPWMHNGTFAYTLSWSD